MCRVQGAALLALGNLAFERTNRRTMLASEGLRELLTRLGNLTPTLALTLLTPNPIPGSNAFVYDLASFIPNFYEP